MHTLVTRLIALLFIETHWGTKRQRNFYRRKYHSLQFSLLLFLQPDYDDHDHDNSRLKPFPSSRGKEKSKDSKKYGE